MLTLEIILGVAVMPFVFYSYAFILGAGSRMMGDARSQCPYADGEEVEQKFLGSGAYGPRDKAARRRGAKRDEWIEGWAILDLHIHNRGN
jgi:hypothetical protein